MDAKKFCKDYNCEEDKPIKTCYKTKALRLHPDKGGNHDEFTALGAAFNEIHDDLKEVKCNAIPVATPVGEAYTQGTAMSAPGTTMSVVVQDQVGSLGSWAFQFAKGGVKWAFSSPTNFMATVGSITILILMTHTSTPAGNPEISFANFPGLRGGKKQTGGIDLKKGAALVFGVFITVLTTLNTEVMDMPIKMDNDNVRDGFQSEMVIVRCAEAVQGQNFDGIYLKPAIGTNPNIERLEQELSSSFEKMEKVDKELQEMKEKNYDVPGYTYIDDYKPIYDSKVKEREGIVKKQENINGTMQELISPKSLYSQIYTNQDSDFNILECKFQEPVKHMFFLKQWMGYASGTAGEKLGPVMKANKEFNRIQSDYQIPTPGTEARIYDIFDINQDTGKVNINKINVTAFDKYIENEIQKMPSYIQKDKNGVEDGYGIMRDLRKYLKYSDIATDVNSNGKESIEKIRNDAFAAKYRFIEKGALMLAIANNLPPEEGLLYVENLVYSHLMNDMLKMSDVIVTGLDATERREKINVKNAIYNLMELTKYSIRMKNDKISSLNNNKVLEGYQAQISAFAAAQKNASWENYLGENIKGAVMFVPNILKPSVQGVGGFAADQILDLCGYILDRMYHGIIDNPGRTVTLAMATLFVVGLISRVFLAGWGKEASGNFDLQLLLTDIWKGTKEVPGAAGTAIEWIRGETQDEKLQKAVQILTIMSNTDLDLSEESKKELQKQAQALIGDPKTISNEKESEGMKALEDASTQQYIEQELKDHYARGSAKKDNMAGRRMIQAEKAAAAAEEELYDPSNRMLEEMKRQKMQEMMYNRKLPTVPRSWFQGSEESKGSKKPSKPPRKPTITQTNEDVKQIEDAAEKAAKRIKDTAQPTSKTTSDPKLLQIEDGAISGGKRKSKKRGKRKTHRNTHGAPRKTKYARKKNTRKKGHGKKKG
tara:strand:+ start:516 stop:3335 length:2820 start_codon:yes stop_codon:yes gene_type:complete